MLCDVLFLFSVLGGCINSSGVVHTGDGIHAVTVSVSRSLGGDQRARALAHEEARFTCLPQDASPVIRDETWGPQSWIDGARPLTLDFQCPPAA